jgi:dTMP kinase
LPAIEAGKVVISDRYTDSSVAYQGGARSLAEATQAVNAYATQGLRPDITFLLITDPEVAYARVSTRGDNIPADRIEAEGIEYQKQVAEAYKDLAKKDEARFTVIDASQTIEEIAEIIKAKINETLPPRRGNACFGSSCCSLLDNGF